MSAKKLGVITVAAVCMLTASIALAQILRKDYEMEFNVGNDEYTINGQIKQFDVKSENLPFIEEGSGKLQMPLRLVIEEMGGSINWNAEDKTTSINYNDTILNVAVDSRKASINGYSIAMKTAPKNVNGCLYVTADFISDNFGTTIQWADDKKQIIMRTETVVRPVVNVNKIEYNMGNLYYSIEIPVITGLNDKNFEKEFNNSFYNKKTEDIKIFAKKAKAEETSENSAKFEWVSTCTAHYRSGQFISISSEGVKIDPTDEKAEENIKEMFNIDLQSQKNIQLSELFKNKKYIDAITKEINGYIRIYPKLYNSEEIEKIEGDELFYINENQLVVIIENESNYMEFKIPFIEIKKQIKSNYEFFINQKVKK